MIEMHNIYPCQGRNPFGLSRSSSVTEMYFMHDNMGGGGEGEQIKMKISGKKLKGGKKTEKNYRKNG